MVNVCGKCEYYMSTEMDQEGNYYHYCGKVDELFPPEPASDTNEPVTNTAQTLKVKFNDTICQYFKKRRGR